ncbi:MAG: hypothetical protein NTX12_04685 [Actinobacteria bacterium]|nr:hypothetical protein [Actinomycetota bacterium]
MDENEWDLENGPLEFEALQLVLLYHRQFSIFLVELLQDDQGDHLVVHHCGVCQNVVNRYGVCQNVVNQKNCSVDAKLQISDRMNRPNFFRRNFFQMDGQMMASHLKKDLMLNAMMDGQLPDDLSPNVKAVSLNH